MLYLPLLDICGLILSIIFDIIVRIHYNLGLGSFSYDNLLSAAFYQKRIYFFAKTGTLRQVWPCEACGHFSNGSLETQLGQQALFRSNHLGKILQNNFFVK